MELIYDQNFFGWGLDNYIDLQSYYGLDLVEQEVGTMDHHEAVRLVFQSSCFFYHVLAYKGFGSDWQFIYKVVKQEAPLLVTRDVMVLRNWIEDQMLFDMFEAGE